MGKQVTFYGASDDLIEVEGDVPGCDEYNADAEEFAIGGLLVAVTYTYEGVWRVSVSQQDEMREVDARVVSLAPGDGDEQPSYSMVLVLDVPDDAQVVRISEGAGDE